MQCNPFAGKPPCHYLPLAEGNYWKYNYSHTENGAGTAVLEVVSIQGADCQLRLRVQTESGTEESDFCVKNEDGVLWRKPGESYYKVIWNNIQAGATTEVMLLHAPFLHAGTTSCWGKENVSTPAGEWQGCSVLNHWEYNSSTQRLRRDVLEQFVEGVGLAAALMQSIAVVPPPVGRCNSQH